LAAVYAQTWERKLLSLANQAVPPANAATVKPFASAPQRRRAYAYCERLTAEHSRSFHLASCLLPPAKRRAIRALYAFCRISDDIVDGTHDNAGSLLAAWRKRALSLHPAPDDLAEGAWTDTRLRYGIPTRYAEQLIAGVAQDLTPTRYATFEEPTTYAYGVASTVGLMSMHIIGFASAEAALYAIRLGVALQLTNILRDVGEDWRAGRVYLPQRELAAFDLNEADIGRGCVDERWRALMRFQIARNRTLYAEAMPTRSTNLKLAHTT